jgi:hypothetical protein
MSLCGRLLQSPRGRRRTESESESDERVKEKDASRWHGVVCEREREIDLSAATFGLEDII